MYQLRKLQYTLYTIVQYCFIIRTVFDAKFCCDQIISNFNYLRQHDLHDYINTYRLTVYMLFDFFCHSSNDNDFGKKCSFATYSHSFRSKQTYVSLTVKYSSSFRLYMNCNQIVDNNRIQYMLLQHVSNVCIIIPLRCTHCYCRCRVLPICVCLNLTST